MITREITSLQHPIVKHLEKLRKNKAYRAECQSAVIPGIKLVQELAKNFSLKTLLAAPGISLEVKAEQMFIVNDAIIKKITGLENPEGIAAEIALPKSSSLSGKQCILALDQIQDPGNLGTLFRTALGLGVEGIYLTEGSVDPFNDKVIRSAKGANFYLPFVEGSEMQLVEFIKKQNLHAYIGDLHAAAVEKCIFKFPCILILGNEARGVQKKLKEIATPVTIPMKNQVESLNVSIAGAILLYALRISRI